MGSGEEIPNRLTQARKTLSRDASIVGTSNINPGTKKLRINVGGQVHEPCASTLKNIPDSPLALMLKDNCKEQLDYDKETNELFFDRHPEVFSQVLDYFQTGKLHHPRNLCGPMFEEELKFWGIEEQQMETCCWHTYTHHRVTQDHLQVFKTQETTEDEPQRSNDLELGQQKDSSQWQTMKYRIWLMLDQPSSSSAAKVERAFYQFSNALVKEKSICYSSCCHIKGIELPILGILLFLCCARIFETQCCIYKNLTGSNVWQWLKSSCYIHHSLH